MRSLDRREPSGGGVSLPATDPHARPPHLASPPDPDLALALEAARHGDEDAFRRLYRAVQPRVLRYLRAVVGTDAEDVASETWEHIARDLHHFHGTYDRFQAWAATICANAAAGPPWSPPPTNWPNFPAPTTPRPPPSTG
ncbi:RNA polymerase sigma factor [Thermomonospora umbrina]|uniref:RNA polymerase sigma factor n=1 Tax=Thermomonospora umbrina TaxID=111806 RepID=UPI001B87C416|nr:sigma factor [Thermomonospora umbrina]